MSRTAVSISESASVALVDPNGIDKTIILPLAATGKFIYVADATGSLVFEIILTRCEKANVPPESMPEKIIINLVNS